MFVTQVRLLSNVKIDENNYYRFSSRSITESHMLNKTIVTRTNVKFVRDDSGNNVFKIDMNVSDLTNINYMMYKNSNKWYYCFVEEINYINDETSLIKFTLDSMMTYQFDLRFGDCVVEREHVEFDTLWQHLVDEDLNVGEYVNISQSTPDMNEMCYIMATTAINEDGTIAEYLGSVVTGIYSGVTLVFFDNELDINQYLRFLGDEGKLDGVINLFMIPKFLVNSEFWGDGVPITQRNVETINFSVAKNTSHLDGYTPKNKKLFAFPYCFLSVNNNNGAVKTYHQEFFSASSSNMSFLISGDISPSCTIQLWPQNYKNNTINFNETMSIGNYPLCSWVGDNYANWLAQNVASNTIGTIASAVPLAVGIATLNPLAIGYGAMSFANKIGGFYDKSNQPNSAGGSFKGNSNVALSIQTFEFNIKTITAERAKIIDDYFTKYGYKVIENKTPYLYTRPRFNYIKCIDTNIYGNIPKKYLDEIRQKFLNGVTFWHDDDVGLYTGNEV